MLNDIQQKLSELTSIEKAQHEINQMKNEHIQTIHKLGEAKRLEAAANDTNVQLCDKIAKLEGDLEQQKFINKDLKREKLLLEQDSMRLATKLDQLHEILKMFQQGADRLGAEEISLMERSATHKALGEILKGDDIDQLEDN